MTFSITKITKTVVSAAFISAAIVPAAFAAEVTNGMDCAMAVKEFHEKHVVYVEEDAPGGTKQPLPMYEGVSVENKDNLKCKEDGNPEPITVPSKDEPQCVVSFKCN